ncbi:GDSL-type esterase/lipase family protein [Cryobacterium algoricola]|uniref:GDSL-type esterase/lipase family protein n=1 Tax=Cryobacterium algoricola TaxID=1259183 RepID=UPI00141B5BFF|nr:GDSL-type esterase/lipase family protein [Cryobacterium algoricola]
MSFLTLVLIVVSGAFWLNIVGRTSTVSAQASLSVSQDAGGPAETDRTSTEPAVVVIGASISAGHAVGPGQAWPDLVQQRLAVSGAPLRVVNASIGATRLLNSYPGLPSSLSRESRDGLDVPGVRTLILTDIINDIQNTPHEYDSGKIVEGIRSFVQAAHARGDQVTILTLTPYGGFATFEVAGEACRIAVNEALRTDTLADGVVDADLALADPGQRDRIRPEYDSGDHLHPNAAGQGALAAAVMQTLAPAG